MHKIYYTPGHAYQATSEQYIGETTLGLRHAQAVAQAAVVDIIMGYEPARKHVEKSGNLKQWEAALVNESPRLAWHQFPDKSSEWLGSAYFGGSQSFTTPTFRIEEV